MSITRVYLGNPAGRFGMQAIPAIFVGGSLGGSGAGMSPVFGRGTVSQTLIGGGVTTQKLAKTKSGYSVGWNIRTPADIDMLMSFFDGGQGGGPYCLVDPSQGNFLPPNVSRMGMVTGSLPEWAVSAGTLAVGASTLAGPTGLLSGVGVWTSAVTGSILYMGLSNQIDGTWLPPALQGLSHRMSIWAKLTSGSCTLTASMLHGIAGAASPSAATGTAAGVALSTSVWQEVSVAIPSSFTWSAGDYVMLKLAVSGATTPIIQLAAPAMVYDTAASASALSPWVAGVGVPRCVIPDTVSSPVGRPGLRDFTMSLAEAA